MPDTHPDQREPHFVLPVGTKVLTRIGGFVGVVVDAGSPRHDYRVRFADGKEDFYHRHDLTIFKHTDATIPGGPEAATLERYVIFRCIVGSTAYGLNQEGSDVDRRGFYLPPAELRWSLAGVPEQLETEREECYWEIEKFIRLGLKANPNILECLYSPLMETCTPLAAQLIGIRHNPPDDGSLEDVVEFRIFRPSFRSSSAFCFPRSVICFVLLRDSLAQLLILGSQALLLALQVALASLPPNLHRPMSLPRCPPNIQLAGFVSKGQAQMQDSSDLLCCGCSGG